MPYFPMCVDLTGRKVLLIGNGPQITDKMEKLRAFGAELVRGDVSMLEIDPALVIVGDFDREDAAQIATLCREKGIPVNVVDDPASSTFFFPALINRDDLTVSVSTGGCAPGVAGYLVRRISEALPERTGEILRWLAQLRKSLYAVHPKGEAAVRLRQLTEQAFALGRPLEEDEI